MGFVVVGVGVATDQPQTHAAYRSACSPIGWVFGEFLFCLVWVEEKKWRFGFFFFAYCGLVVVVVVLMLAVADGRGSYGRCCVCFLSNGIYYFIVMVILFYCDVYIILLC